MVAARDTTTDEGLLAAAAAGNREAFAVFYRRYLPAVVLVLLRETNDRELAADLTGEVFAAALLSAGRYRPEAPTALPWLSAIARHKARDSLRRGRAERRARRRIGIPREDIEDDDLHRVDELAAQGGRMVALLEELPEAQRSAVRARVIEGLEYSEIASTSGASEALVRQRVRRGLSRLRDRATGEEAP